jgi:hypothetical protein
MAPHFCGTVYRGYSNGGALPGFLLMLCAVLQSSWTGKVSHSTEGSAAEGRQGSIAESNCLACPVVLCRTQDTTLHIAFGMHTDMMCLLTGGGGASSAAAVGPQPWCSGTGRSRSASSTVHSSSMLLVISDKRKSCAAHHLLCDVDLHVFLSC